MKLQRRYLVLLLLFLTLVGGFFYQKTAFADVPQIANNGTDYNYTAEAKSDGAYSPINPLSQSFLTTNAFNLGTIILRPHIYYQADGYVFLEIYNDSTKTFVASSTAIWSNDLAVNYQPVAFTFENPVSLNAATTYWFRIRSTRAQTGGDYSIYLKGWNPSNYADGCLAGSSLGSLWTCYDRDLWFEIYVGITNSVIIPTISTSITANISFNWQYHLDSATTSLGYYTIFPDWNLYKCEPTCDTKIGSNLGYNSHPNNNNATGTTAGFTLDNGNYQIKNFYLKYDSVGAGSLTASTTQVDSNEFSVSYTTPYIPIISLPTSTIASTTPIQITCDPNDTWYNYSLCKIGIWLFIPSQSVLNQFSNLTADISLKPPIGYFTSIKNALSGFTSSTPAFTINVNSDDPVNTTFFNPIRTGLIWILWLAFAFWIFHRFRHFNFTSP